MNKLMALLLASLLIGCSGGRNEKDLTDSDEQNSSPDQTISPEELPKKTPPTGILSAKTLPVTTAIRVVPLQLPTFL